MGRLLAALVPFAPGERGRAGGGPAQPRDRRGEGGYLFGSEGSSVLQAIDDEQGKTLASASTRDAKVRTDNANGGSIDATQTINVNGGNFYAADAPFGGYKQSGVGREMGREGFEEYLETKTIAIGV